MPLVKTTPFNAGPVGWVEKTGTPFASNTSGARPLWLLPDDTVLVGHRTRERFRFLI